MLSREDFYMIKQMRQQGAYIVDIATQIGCSERTVRRYLKYPEPPARKTRHKMVKLKPFMDYIDMRLAENVWNSEVIFAEIKAMGYTGGRSMLRYYIQPKRKMRPSKRTVRFETQPGYQLQHDWGEVEVEVVGQRCKVNFAVNSLGFSRRFHVFAAPKQDAEHTYESLVRAFRYFGGCVKTVLVDNQKAAVLKNNNGKVVFNSGLPVGINATRQIAAAQQEMAREASNRAESALHGFSSSIASAWNTLSQFGSNRGSSDSVTGGADSTMSAQDSMMASRMRSAVESYAKAHNISNEQATQELASRSTRASAGMYGDAHAEWGVKPKILGVGGGLGVRGGGRAGIDWSDDDAHQASSGSRASNDARHDIDARATQDFKEASDYFTSRKVSESGSHTDNNADSRVDQLSAALNSAKQSYDQYTTNMTRSHEYAEMASRTESMSGQMSEDLSQQFAQYVMKHAPQDAEAILTNTSSPEIAERRRAMAWSFVQEQIQPGVDNAWRESRGDIGKGMESVPSGGGSQDIIADHQGHQAIIEQRTQDSNIRNDVKHQVDNMVTEYKGNIGDTQNSIRGEENIVRGQYSELQNHHKTEALSQNNKYNEEKSVQERMPGADSPQELMKRAKEYQDKYK